MKTKITHGLYNFNVYFLIFCTILFSIVNSGLYYLNYRGIINIGTTQISDSYYYLTAAFFIIALIMSLYQLITQHRETLIILIALMGIVLIVVGTVITYLSDTISLILPAQFITCVGFLLISFLLVQAAVATKIELISTVDRLYVLKRKELHDIMENIVISSIFIILLAVLLLQDASQFEVGRIILSLLGFLFLTGVSTYFRMKRNSYIQYDYVVDEYRSIVLFLRAAEQNSDNYLETIAELNNNIESYEQKMTTKSTKLEELVNINGQKEAIKQEIIELTNNIEQLNESALLQKQLENENKDKIYKAKVWEKEFAEQFEALTAEKNQEISQKTNIAEILAEKQQEVEILKDNLVIIENEYEIETRKLAEFRTLSQELADKRLEYLAQAESENLAENEKAKLIRKAVQVAKKFAKLDVDIVVKQTLVDTKQTEMTQLSQRLQNLEQQEVPDLLYVVKNKEQHIEQLANTSTEVETAFQERLTDDENVKEFQLELTEIVDKLAKIVELKEICVDKQAIIGYDYLTDIAEIEEYLHQTEQQVSQLIQEVELLNGQYQAKQNLIIDILERQKIIVDKIKK
jgi:hypothetical protein